MLPPYPYPPDGAYFPGMSSAGWDHPPPMMFNGYRQSPIEEAEEVNEEMGEEGFPHPHYPYHMNPFPFYPQDQMCKSKEGEYGINDKAHESESYLRHFSSNFPCDHNHQVVIPK